jgi:ABC-2 type transport system permease protein
LTVGFVTFAVGEVFYKLTTGSFLSIQNGLTLVVFLVLGGISFAQLGLAVAFWAKTFDQMAAVGAFLLTPLIYLGGVFFSIEGLNEFWRSLSLFNPLLYFINGVRLGILGISDVPLGRALVVSLFSMFVFQTIALYSLKRGEYSRW